MDVNDVARVAVTFIVYAGVAFVVAAVQRQRRPAVRVARAIGASVAVGFVATLVMTFCSTVADLIAGRTTIWGVLAVTVFFGTYFAVLSTVIGLLPAIAGAFAGWCFFRSDPAEPPRAG